MGAPRLDLDWVRERFPAFQAPSLAGFSHLENAGGSYACAPAIEALQRFYVETKLQPYYPSAPSSAGGAAMDRARAGWAAWLNVPQETLHFGPSTTQNTYVLAQALRGHLEPGDEIVVTNQDHEANVGAWRRLENDGFVVREWAVDPVTGELDAAGLEAVLSEKTRVVAFTHCSNVVAHIHPVADWVERIHAAGAIAIVDGVSYCPHAIPDLAALGADVYLFSLYKVYGPHLGLMYIDADLNRAWPNQGHFFNAGKATSRFTPAGPDHAQVAAAAGVIDYFDALYEHHFDAAAAPAPERAARLSALFREQERRLARPLLDWLAAHPRVRVVGPVDPDDRAPTVSFTIEGTSPRTLSERLAEEALGIGWGHFYAYRLVEALGIDTDEGVARISFVHYTRDNDIRRVIEALDRLIG